MNEYSPKNMIKFLIIVLVIIVVFYFITVAVSKKQTKQNTDSGEISVIQYDNIILGNIFTMEDNDFYVLALETDDSYTDNYKTYVSSYISKEDSLKFYYADLGSAFNKKYIGDSENLEKENFMIKGTILLRIKDNKITESYSDSDSIIEKLSEMSS